MLLIRAANMAVAMSIPAMSSVVTFLVYAGTGHQLAFRRFLLVDLVPAVALTSYDASLARPIFEPSI